MRQNSIHECFGSIRHNSDVCTIRGPNFTPPSLIMNMNQFNALNGDDPAEKPRDWNRQPTSSYFKYRAYPPKISPVVSAIMGILKYHSINNGDVEVHPSEFPVESNPESVPYTYTTPLQSNKLMIMKWTISCNYPTQNLMMIF